jgi:hypothetical protein
VHFVSDKIIDIDDLQLDNTIKIIPETETEPEHYGADNGIVKSDFYQLENRVIYTFKGRQFIWKPLDMKYIDEFGTEDVLFTVTDVPLETKANYARFNRAMPDVDDWFIQENRELKHQILIQGFQRDPFEFLFGNIDFAIGGQIIFDADLTIIADGVEQTGLFETTGGIDFVDANGERFFHLPEVVAYDSKIPNRAMTTGKYRAYNDGSGVVSFQIIVANEWISNIERVYPLVIDPTVIVSAAYSTVGNGGRKIVRLSNGWLVAAAFSSSDSRNYYYKSTDNGTTWTQLCWNTTSRQGVALASVGTSVVAIYNNVDEVSISRAVFDATTVANAALPTNTIFNAFTSGYTSDYLSIVADGSGVYHVAYATKTSSYPNSKNIFYTKSTDGGSTWAAATQLTTDNASGVQNDHPSIAIKSDGHPIISNVQQAASIDDLISVQKYNGSSWSSTGVYFPQTAEGFTSILVKKNGSNIGRIFVALEWSNSIRVRYSDDGGSGWSSLTNDGFTGTKPTISENALGEVFVFYQTGSNVVYRPIANGGTSFLSESTVNAGSNPSVMEREVSTVIGIVYMDASVVKFDKLLYNATPLAPTNLVPTGGTIKDRAQVIRFSWQYNDSPGDTQSKFDLQYRLQGAGTWTTVTQTTPNQFYDMPAATLAAGAYEWQVRTYDSGAVVGPYSSISAFNAATKTPTPTITAPANGATIATASQTATWSSVAQVQYELKLLDATGVTTLWTDTRTSASTSKTITPELSNNTTYQLSLRVMDAGGIWSDADINTFNVSFTAPGIPTISLVKDDVRGTVTATVQNPYPAGTVPALANNEIYRRENAGAWVRIATATDALAIPAASVTNNFVGKVSGSTAENPHISKRANDSVLRTPSAFSFEANTADYGQLAVLDGVSDHETNTINTQISQQLFSFNLIALVERSGLIIPATDKVAWLKANVTKILANWWGYGSGPSGNKAYLARWSANSSNWNDGTIINHTNGTVTKLTTQTLTPTTMIDTNGFVHFLAYADASNGTTASTINTDFIELVVDFQPGTENVAPANIMNNFVGKVSGSLVENPHIGKRTVTGSTHTALLTPATFTGGGTNEQSTADYSNSSTLNGVVVSSTTNINAAIAQHLFSFDLIALIERGGFSIPSSDKVQWLKDNVKKMTANWWGYGSAPSGNFAKVAWWTGSWTSGTGAGWEHSQGTVTKISPFTIKNATSWFTNSIDSSGFVHILAYTNASNGTVSSIINTDYVELVVEFNYNVNRGTFIDYTPQPGATIEYYAQAVGVNSTFAQGPSATITPNVAFTQLASLTDETKYVTLQKGSTLQKNNVIDSAKMKFAGRDFAMTEFGTTKESAFDYKYLVFTWAELQTVEELAMSGETLLLRDNKGRKTYVTLNGVGVNEVGTHWEITIRPERVYYVEGV